MAVHAWPSLAGWLDNDLSQLQKAIVFRAFADVGICENPVSSNRGGRIDEYNKRAGAPLGSYWCASFATAVWEDCGAAVPADSRASTKVLMAWAKKHGLWQPTPVVGALVIYGKDDEAEHVGIVVRTLPIPRSIEGNASIGGANSRNGESVEFKAVAMGWKLGYIHPVAEADLK